MFDTPLMPGRFDGHFPGEPGLASTRMSPFCILLDLQLTYVAMNVLNR